MTIATGRARRTQFNWVATTAGAALNFALNLWLIPAYGMLGAAYATLAGYILIMVLRTWNAQQVYPVQYQWRRVAVLVLAAGALTAARQDDAAVAAARVRPHGRLSAAARGARLLPAGRAKAPATTASCA